MKMSTKLIIIFSALAIVITIVLSVASFNTNVDNLLENTFVSLDTIGTKMQSEIENYIQLMDYSIEELTSSSQFMDGFYTVSQNSAFLSDDLSTPETPFSRTVIEEISLAQTAMSQVLYQAPLSSAFFRVSAYNQDGFFLTSRFEKTEVIVSFSEEAQEVFDSLDYLELLQANHFRHIVIGPHGDPWTAGSAPVVFSVVKAALWHGTFVGYIEVSASLDDLADIFWINQEGFQVQAEFDDGLSLFRSRGSDEIYPDMKVGEMVYYTSSDGTEQMLVKQYSKTLGLSIYVSQNLDTLLTSRMEILSHSLTTVIPALIAAIVLIIFLSLQLTGSIRKLERKIQLIPADDFLAKPELAVPTTVVRTSDKEIYHLEQSFNNLLDRLSDSYENQTALREGALKAQLNALQLQINPHFVYNTLNIISAKGLESGSEEIAELCDQFAQMLRYSTDTRSSDASLREEIENVRHYLYLCKSRFEDTLEYDISVPEEILDIRVPKLTLQPLVENALKYGIQNSLGLHRIHISGRIEQKELILIVQDNGDGFQEEVLDTLRLAFEKIENGQSPESAEGVAHLGLINTYRRLYYYSHGNICMELFNAGGAVVKLSQTMTSEAPSSAVNASESNK